MPQPLSTLPRPPSPLHGGSHAWAALLTMAGLAALVGLLGLSSAAQARSPSTPAPGRYTLWQDGEGGPTCQLRLTTHKAIGGQAIEGGQRCAARLKLEGDPYAWFVDAQGRVVILDATRQPLLRMERLADGDYKDRRQGDYVDAVLLTRDGP
jgi:hypothetical protein